MLQQSIHSVVVLIFILLTSTFSLPKHEIKQELRVGHQSDRHEEPGERFNSMKLMEDSMLLDRIENKRNASVLMHNEERNIENSTNYHTECEPNTISNSSDTLNSSWPNISCSNSSKSETSNMIGAKQTNTLDLMSKILIFAFAFVFVVGVFGNTFVCYTFGYKCRRRRTVTESLILYLAIADLIASAVNPLLYIYWIGTGNSRWDFGMIGCKILPPIAPISTTVSAAIIILICIDRYRSIVTPFKTRLNIVQINIITIILVILSIVSYSSYIIKLDILENMTCLLPDIGDKEYSIPFVSLTLVFDFMYVLIFVPAYIRIFRHLKANDNFSPGTTYWEHRKKETRKVLRVLFTVGVIFAILVFPRDIAQLAFTFSWMSPPGIGRSDALVTLNNWLKFLHVSNSSVNIFIYSHMHDNFKRELKLLFKRIFRRRHTASPEDNEFTDRGTSTENYADSPLHPRRDSLLQKLALKSKPLFKNKKSVGNNVEANKIFSDVRRSPAGPSPNLSIRGEVPHNNGFMKQTRASPDSTAFKRAPAYRLTNFDRDRNLGVNRDAVKRIGDALQLTARNEGTTAPSCVRDNSASSNITDLKHEDRTTCGATAQFIKAHNNRADERNSLARKQTVPNSFQTTKEDTRKPTNTGFIGGKMNHKHPCKDFSYRSEPENEQAALIESDSRGVLIPISHEQVNNNEETVNTVNFLKGFSALRLFGLRSEISSHCGGDSETNKLLEVPASYDVTTGNSYDETNIASLLKREQKEGLQTKETNC